MHVRFENGVLGGGTEPLKGSYIDELCKDMTIWSLRKQQFQTRRIFGVASISPTSSNLVEKNTGSASERKLRQNFNSTMPGPTPRKMSF